MNASAPLWQSIAILVGRLIFAGVFIMAATFKFLGMDATATYIAAAGFPFPLLLAWLAAIFELGRTIRNARATDSSSQRSGERKSAKFRG